MSRRAREGAVLSLVLAMIAQHRTFDLVPGHPIVPNPQITLGLKHGLRVHARERVRSDRAPATTC